MKDISVPQTNPEHGCSKHSPSSSTFSKNSVDHGYAKLSSSKKSKKLSIIDPKQRKLSFAKIPSIKHSEKIVIDSSNSESDEPLALFKNGKSIDPTKKVTETDESSKNTIGSVTETTRNGSLDATLSKKVGGNIEQLPASPKKSKKETIGSEAFATHKNSSPSKMANCNSKKKDSCAKMKPFKADGKRENGLKLSKKSAKINVPSDSDSDLDVPLSQLKNSPKFKKSEKAKLIAPSHLKKDHTKKKFSKSAEKLKKLSHCERSPKMKISHAKSPNMKNKVHGEKGLKQKTLFDFRAQMKNEPSFAKERKSLTEEEREKIRQQKKEEWNKIRRERKKMLNQKHDDLELQNVAPLPAPKPIEMEGGLANTAFGDIAMLVEFVYVFNKFLAPEETPSITAEQLIKALAAGGQGADVISKILLVFLRALIGEEEREINGLGIGLADMPLTVFTVSELLYHYLRLTCSKPAKGNKANDSKDGDEEDEEEDDDASSVASTNHGFVDEEEMPRRIINWLEKNEFFTLSASDKLKVLVFLFHKIIDSEYYSDYSENLRMETRELWRQQDAFRKKAAKERKEEQSKNAENKSPAISDSMTIDKFVKKLDSTQISDSLGTDENEKTNEADDKEKEEKAEDKEKKEEKKEEKKGEKKEEKKEEKKKVIDVEKRPEKSEVEEGKNLELSADDELMKDYPKEPVADLVHIVRQRRVMAAKQAALKGEEEKKEKERRKEMDELQQKMKKIQAWKDGLDKCKRSLRLEPVGLDRHFKLYWVFSNGMPGIYVEDGWMYDAGEKRTIDSWEYYDSVEAVDKLLKALATQGIRESALKACLSSQYKTITSLIKKRNPDNCELQPYDVFEESIKVLKEDMLESGSKIVKGVLGMISNQEQWESKITEGRTLEEMIPLVLELQQSVLPKFLQGTMEKEEVVKNWRENVKAGKTLSTLHTLLGILENSVKWDKSAENVKCKICRRKGGDEYLVLCDECNRGYHPYCLRPALLDFPSGSWKCPACQPAAPASRARTRRKEEPVDYYQTGQDEESAEEEDDEKEQLEGEEESDHESLCHVCGEDGELICCDQCPKVYHLDCHEPPIRRLPRGIWICFVCRNPKMAMRFRRAQHRLVCIRYVGLFLTHLLYLKQHPFDLDGIGTTIFKIPVGPELFYFVGRYPLRGNDRDRRMSMVGECPWDGISI
ncbi:tyrosine-protein kinase BAZ1B-like isoform X2 [Rhopilema esculentum]|uniref:tyrosine-protein kinase BAZ1B-like isoform X2 n=1 Tax=Rhopilema esculentum TaxID=499914 RepID=UPI0031DE3C46